MISPMPERNPDDGRQKFSASAAVLFTLTFRHKKTLPRKSAVSFEGLVSQAE
ncbi:hypothetical protein [Bacillus sp. YBsi01]|uniref:hypothetical protein n=1 Tax=Bacillus TaxID=1386 RepID=UPI00313994BE